MKTLAELREYRDNTLFNSLQEVADRAGLSRMAISMFERGIHPPRKSNYKKFAKGYRKPVSLIASILKNEQKKAVKKTQADAAGR